jgi:hypothetical protein
MTREFANIHADLCELRRLIASEHSNDGAWTAVDYLDEARQLEAYIAAKKAEA